MQALQVAVLADEKVKHETEIDRLRESHAIAIGALKSKLAAANANVKDMLASATAIANPNANAVASSVWMSLSQGLDGLDANDIVIHSATSAGLARRISDVRHTLLEHNIGVVNSVYSEAWQLNTATPIQRAPDDDLPAPMVLMERLTQTQLDFMTSISILSYPTLCLRSEAEATTTTMVDILFPVVLTLFEVDLPMSIQFQTTTVWNVDNEAEYLLNGAQGVDQHGIDLNADPVDLIFYVVLDVKCAAPVMALSCVAVSVRTQAPTQPNPTQPNHSSEF